MLKKTNIFFYITILLIYSFYFSFFYEKNKSSLEIIIKPLNYNYDYNKFSIKNNIGKHVANLLNHAFGEATIKMTTKKKIQTLKNENIKNIKIIDNHRSSIVIFIGLDDNNFNFEESIIKEIETMVISDIIGKYIQNINYEIYKINLSNPNLLKNRSNLDVSAKDLFQFNNNTLITTLNRYIEVNKQLDPTYEVEDWVLDAFEHRDVEILEPEQHLILWQRVFGTATIGNFFMVEQRDEKLLLDSYNFIKSNILIDPNLALSITYNFN